MARIPDRFIFLWRRAARKRCARPAAFRVLAHGAVVTETQTCENVLTTVWYGNITVPVDHLLTEQANVLRKAMLEARKALDEASEKYEHTLAAGIRPDASDQEMLTTRRVGRAYAEALTQYSNATMPWLTYVDAHLRPKKTGARETH